VSSLRRFVQIILSMLLLCAVAVPQHQPSASRETYLGFDRNDYPGDRNLTALRRDFSYAGYWLSNPPGERGNSWRGKRTTLEHAGFGFLLLFNGRTYDALKGHPNPGARDGSVAVEAAKAEGFRLGSIIFLDQEQGGRMLPEQKLYVRAWARAVRRGGYTPGIYCSGIEVAEQGSGTISTARDLHDSLGEEMVYWIANDACPPSPGCSYPRQPPAPELSGARFAEVWQYAQSPRRSQFTSACAATYNKDQNCYAPRGALPGIHLDVNASRTPDPSHTR
jgi:hypothetical protein